MDTHAHLDLSDYHQDREEVIARALERGVGAVVTVGCDLPSSGEAIGLAERYPGVFAAVGFHPHDATKMTEKSLEELRLLARHPKVIAVGEIGLDFYRHLSPKEAQREALVQQLRLAADEDLPVLLHCREAHEEMWEMLSQWARERRPRGAPLGVLHCFSGDRHRAYQYSELGFFISFAGPLTYPKSQRSREVAPSLPAETLLVETDCPFLSPQGHHGQRNEPSFLVEVASKLAELRETTPEAIGQQTTQNARRLFSRPAFQDYLLRQAP